ncbi:MAG: GIY-YIG nuclease family protein, partial [Faecalibacterium sp.]|nr:GIY-YIG nuclease family protein [Faecalibacterium sp.]
ERCADRCAALRREAALKKLPKAQKELLCTAWQAAGRPFAEHGAGSAG